jgi:UPF0755 protein
VKRAVWIILSAALLLAVIAILVLGWCGRAPGNGRECLFTVECGWGARRISEALADSGMIRCPLYFLWKYSEIQISLPLQAGIYQLDDGMDPESIMITIARGAVVPVPTHWVTLTPGLTLDQSLAQIAGSLDRSKGLLDSLAADRGLLDSLGVPYLEGHLFPETYEFADSLQTVEILSRIVETGRESLPPDWELKAGRLGLDPEEVFILASIVEREGKVDAERSMIAGVFLSRLRRGMRLESCATVQYALGEVREVLLYSDLELESPYNTYLVTGLPPGPICSPGLPSIEAALTPDTSAGYLYFVSTGDGSGRHLFACSYAGHLANRRLVSDGTVD